MSIISQFYHVPCKLQNPQLFPSKSSLSFSPNFLKLSTSSSSSSSFNLSSAVKVKSTAEDDEWGPEPEGRAVRITGPPPVEDPVVVERTDLKKQLADLFDGTNRGLKASRQKRAEIIELVTKIEAENPNFDLNTAQDLSLLNGKWILVYTSLPGLFPQLPIRTLPVVTVEEISETLDSENFTVQAFVQFSGPLATNSLSTKSKFEVRSSKIVQVKFEEAIIGTPQPTDNLPANVEVLGQNIDISPLKSLIDSLQGTTVARTISSQPPLKINLAENVQLWVLDTYVDEEIRILRGDVGSVSVFFREGSPLLSPEQT